MNNQKTGEYIVWAGAILHVFGAFIFATCISYRTLTGESVSPGNATTYWYILSWLIGGPFPFIILAEIIAAILGFCSWEDTIFRSSSSSSSSNSSSIKYQTRNRLYLNSGENIIFHVETYEVFHGEGGGYYWTYITGELCYQCGIITQVKGQGRSSTKEVAYMQARDDYEQNLEQAKQDARIRLRR